MHVACYVRILGNNWIRIRGRIQTLSTSLNLYCQTGRFQIVILNMVKFHKDGGPLK